MEPIIQEKVNFITHNGTRLLFINVNGVADVSVLREFVTYTVELILEQPEKSVYFLGDVRDANFNSSLINLLKDAILKVKPHLVASAYVSSGGLQEIILKGLAKVTKRNMKAFRDLEEAKNWLAAQE